MSFSDAFHIIGIVFVYVVGFGVAGLIAAAFLRFAALLLFADYFQVDTTTKKATLKGQAQEHKRRLFEEGDA